ncbi:MAG: adenosylcobinamide-phosphate synthase CbiB [Lachnospiraceae bacterium]|nr:adenosylcobinamide-phosphate synthase CbiB [Lachnospiraceae bacterium]
MILHTQAFGLGILLDLIIGDPHSFPHPIRVVGALIGALDKALNSNPDEKPQAARRKGIMLWICVMLCTFAATFFLLAVLYKVGRIPGGLGEAVLTCYILSARSLCKESMAVSKKLKEDDLAGARSALSMIVGRDTAVLDREEVIKGAVETVSENTSDGVIAPLLYTAIGGPVLGMAYKAVNTMDSMLGYHNEKYEHFGFFAAKADDVCNFLPARISALLMIGAAAILGCFSKAYDAAGALRICKRDRKNHTSPNSAMTESVCAGALGLQLGGTHLYQGIPVGKPTIGDAKRAAETKDIFRANVLMFMTKALSLLLLFAILIFLCKR